MKTKNSIFFLILAAGLLTYSSFKQAPAPSVDVHQKLSTDIQHFKQKLRELGPYIEKLDRDSSYPMLLQKKFLEVRLAYKQIEFLLEYLSPTYVKDYLNGPPLLRLAKNVAGVVVEEPVSLQKLEELVFAENPIQEKLEIQKNYDKILDYLGNLNFIVQEKLTDRHVFESLRFGLVRHFSLGLTGFDTPASGNTMEECLASLQAMAQTFDRYSNFHSSRRLTKSIQHTYKEALGYLKKHQDFDTFDRLHFFKNYTQPLYSQLLEYHLATHVETLGDITSLELPINYNEPYIFSENFLNRYYFNGLDSKKDNAKIAAVGKMLFFDPILSVNNERSCASCHQPEKAFTDGQRKSIALDFKGTVDRNAPGLIDATYSARQFWDMRATQLEQQAEHVIVSAKEFHTDYYVILSKLNQSSEYLRLFKEAFGGKDPINKDNFSMALAAYVASLTSFNSEFDKYMRGEVKTLAPEIKRGFNLFMGKAACGTCHFAPVFNGLVPPFYNDSEAEVLGVPSSEDKEPWELDEDLGRALGQYKERSPIFDHAFKTPTVRNVAFTAPYMHNGAFRTLDKVMEFYNNGGGKGHGLNVPNQTLPEDSLHLSKQEISDIVAFMQALSDTSGLTSKPQALPRFEGNAVFNTRKVSGTY